MLPESREGNILASLFFLSFNLQQVPPIDQTLLVVSWQWEPSKCCLQREGEWGEDLRSKGQRTEYIICKPMIAAVEKQVKGNGQWHGGGRVWFYIREVHSDGWHVWKRTKWMKGGRAKLLSGGSFLDREADAMAMRWEHELCVWGTARSRCGWSYVNNGKRRRGQKNTRESRAWQITGKFLAMVRILFSNWVKWKAIGDFWTESGLTWFKILQWFPTFLARGTSAPMRI